MGSGIPAPGSGITSRGIGISSTVRGSGIQLSDNIRDHKILKCALIGGTKSCYITSQPSQIRADIKYRIGFWQTDKRLIPFVLVCTISQFLFHPYPLPYDLAIQISYPGVSIITADRRNSSATFLREVGCFFRRRSN